jgi:iron(III) transport system substrate-binding protein
VTVRTRTWRAGLLVLLVSALAAGCGGSPSAQDDDQAAKPKDTATKAIEKINAQLEGLEGNQRRAKLIELADKEGGTVSAYGSTNIDEATPFIDAFEDETGIDVSYYRANSENVLARVIEESKAGFKGADVVFTNGPELTLLQRKGLLASYDSPATAEIPEQGVHPTWKWFYLNTFTPAWNTKEVSGAQAPKSWEDVLKNYKGKLALELSDVDWFATLVKEYFEPKGISEDEAVKLFKDAAAGSTVVDGHTLMTELLAGGEFGIAASPYLHRIMQMKKQGASVEWEPAIEPLIVRPNGVAIHAAAQRPASALLFNEFLVTDAQSLLLEVDRQPASAAVEGGGLPTRYKNVVVDVETVIDEFDKWSGLYDEIVKQSGGKVVED